jgi:hypothetical protein
MLHIIQQYITATNFGPLHKAPYVSPSLPKFGLKDGAKLRSTSVGFAYGGMMWTSTSSKSFTDSNITTETGTRIQWHYVTRLSLDVRCVK